MQAATKNGPRGIFAFNMYCQDAAWNHYHHYYWPCYMHRFKQSSLHDKNTNLWERLLWLLTAVDPTTRFVSPNFIRLRTSMVDRTRCILASGRVSPPLLVQFRISNLLLVKKKEAYTTSIYMEQRTEQIKHENKGYFVVDASSERRSRTCSLYISTIWTWTLYLIMSFLLQAILKRSLRAR